MEFFVIGIYEPIKPEEAICRSVQFDRYHSYFSKNGSTRYIELLNQKSIFFPDVYFYGKQSIEDDLRALESNTMLNLKLHKVGTILEITTEQKEILNFDYAQKQLWKDSMFIFILGTLSFFGMIACTAYAMIKIIKHKVFAPSKRRL